MQQTFPGLDPALQQLRKRSGLERGASFAELRAALEGLVEAEPSELQRFDPLLIHLRVLETATANLPPIINGVRLGALLSWDRVSSTWRGNDVESGQARAVRVLHPAHAGDPVWLRRLERGTAVYPHVPCLVRGRWFAGEGLPHVHFRLQGTPLSRFLPPRDPADPILLARVLVLSLSCLSRLHGKGLVHGSLAPESILLHGSGLRLLWFDPVLSPVPRPGDDIAALARCIAELDPESGSSLSQLVAQWESFPPASADDALVVIRRTFADVLSLARHRMAFRARHGARRSRAGSLRALVNRLSLALPPPVGRSCLKADSDGALVVVRSDGRRVLGGMTFSPADSHLPLVYEPGHGVNPQGARFLMRAWARRHQGDSSRRRVVQEAMGGSDGLGEAMVRWLACQNRLRSARLLLEKAAGLNHY